MAKMKDRELKVNTLKQLKEAEIKTEIALKKNWKISWNEIEDWINKLSTLIKDKNYIGIYGVPKGGLIFATLLAYKTKLPLLQAPEKNCLVVDDIIGTGVALIDLANRYDTAVMLVEKNCFYRPTYLYKEVTDEYILFPWFYDREELNI